MDAPITRTTWTIRPQNVYSMTYFRVTWAAPENKLEIIVFQAKSTRRIGFFTLEEADRILTGLKAVLDKEEGLGRFAPGPDAQGHAPSDQILSAAPTCPVSITAHATIDIADEYKTSVVIRLADAQDLCDGLGTILAGLQADVTPEVAE